MKKSISRKINLALYGGKTYEMADFMIEDENKSFADLQTELEEAIISFIKDIPVQSAKFQKAKEEQPPFIAKGEIETKSPLIDLKK